MAEYPGWTRDATATNVWISNNGRCPKCRKTHRNAEFICQKCRIRVRYNYYVELESAGLDTNPHQVKAERIKPTALPIFPRSGHQNKEGTKTPKSAAGNNTRTPQSRSVTAQ